MEPDPGSTSARLWARDRLLAALYDWEHDELDEDLPLYQALAARSSGPVLELACGSGRVLQALAESGTVAVGLDQSEAMLARARERLLHCAGAVELMLGDFEQYLPRRRFGLVILALHSLGYVPTPERQIALLTRLADLLGADGLLAIDLASIASLAEAAEGVAILQHAGQVPELDAEAAKWMVQRVDWAQQSMHWTSFFELTWPDRSTSRLTESVTLRWFVKTELELLLHRAGLEIEQLFGDYLGGAFTTASERMVVIARRSEQRRD